MMHLACQERLLPGDTLIERWDSARRAGYDGIELHGHPDFALRERLPELRQAAAAGVVFSSVCVAMRHFIGDFDAELRRDAIDNLKSQLSVIAELGGVGVVTPAAYGMYTRKLPPFTPPPRTEEEDARRARRRRSPSSASTPPPDGVAVLFEPLNRYEDHMINRLDQGAAICRAVGSDAVKLVVDTYHMNIEEDDPADARYARAGELVGHVQLGDSARWQPGTGHVDFAAIVDALHDIGFDGWLALECNLRGDPMDGPRPGLGGAPPADRPGSLVKLGMFLAVYHDRPFEPALDRAVALGLDAVEIATGNYPGDDALPARRAARRSRRPRRLPASGRGPRPDDQRAQPAGQPAAPRPGGRQRCPRHMAVDGAPRRRARRRCRQRLLRLPRRSRRRGPAELGHVLLADGLPGHVAVAVGAQGGPVLDRRGGLRRRSRRHRRHRDASRVRRLQPGDPAALARRLRPGDRRQLRPEPPVLAGHRSHRRHPPSRTDTSRSPTSTPRTPSWLPTGSPSTASSKRARLPTSHERAWLFRTIGLGHGERVWGDIVDALRDVGYDGTVSIEHEDRLLPADEGLEKAVTVLARFV